jgi:hypothetical protein
MYKQKIVIERKGRQQQEAKDTPYLQNILDQLSKLREPLIKSKHV